jgi:hypothetical protein
MHNRESELVHENNMQTDRSRAAHGRVLLVLRVRMLRSLTFWSYAKAATAFCRSAKEAAAGTRGWQASALQCRHARVMVNSILAPLTCGYARRLSAMCSRACGLAPHTSVSCACTAVPCTRALAHVQKERAHDFLIHRYVGRGTGAWFITCMLALHMFACGSWSVCLQHSAHPHRGNDAQSACTECSDSTSVSLSHVHMLSWLF